MANSLVANWRLTDPKTTQGRSDDELTLEFADHYSPEELAAKYPDWAKDYETITRTARLDIEREGLTAGDKARSIFGNVVRGAAGVVATVPEYIAEASKAQVDAGYGLLGDQPGKPIEEYATYKAGRAIRSAAEAITPTQKESLADSFAFTTAPQAVGSGLGFLAGGVAGKVAKIPALATTSFLGATAGGSELAEDARAHGADNLTTVKALGLGSLIGLSEAIPLERMLRRLDGASGGAFSKLLSKTISSKLAGKGGEVTAELARDVFEESVQEAAQGAAGNAVAAALYDPSRNLFEGLKEDAGGAAVSGFVLSALTQAIGRARRAPAQAAPPADQGDSGSVPVTTPPAGSTEVVADDSITPATAMMADNELAAIAQRIVDGEDVDIEAKIPESEFARFAKILSNLKERTVFDASRPTDQPIQDVPVEEAATTAAVQGGAVAATPTEQNLQDVVVENEWKGAPPETPVTYQGEEWLASPRVQLNPKTGRYTVELIKVRNPRTGAYYRFPLPPNSGDFKTEREAYEKAIEFIQASSKSAPAGSAAETPALAAGAEAFASAVKAAEEPAATATPPSGDVVATSETITKPTASLPTDTGAASTGGAVAAAPEQAVPMAGTEPKVPEGFRVFTDESGEPVYRWRPSKVDPNSPPSGIDFEKTDFKSAGGGYYVWRSMGPQEVAKLLDGKKTYGGTGSKGAGARGESISQYPAKAAKWYDDSGSEEKYLVEFAGAKPEGEVSKNKLTLDNVTRIWRRSGGAWTLVPAAEYKSISANKPNETQAPQNAQTLAPAQQPAENKTAAESVVADVKSFKGTASVESVVEKITTAVDQVSADAANIGTKIEAVVDQKNKAEKEGDTESVAALKNEQKVLTEQLMAAAKAKQDLEQAAEKAKESGVKIEDVVAIKNVDLAGGIRDSRNKGGKPVLGYFEMRDGTESAEEMENLYKQYKFAKGTPEEVELEKREAANKLGKLLIMQAMEEGSRGSSRRMTAWLAPDKSVAVMLVTDSGSTDRGVNQRFRFSTKEESGRGKASTKKGLTDLLDAGFMPIASIRLKTFHGNLARHFSSIEEYNKEFGQASKLQQAEIDQVQSAYTQALSAAPTQQTSTASRISTAEETGTETGDESITPEEAVDLAESDESLDQIAERLFKPREGSAFYDWCNEYSDFVDDVVAIAESSAGDSYSTFIDAVLGEATATFDKVNGRPLSQADRIHVARRILQDSKALYYAIKSKSEQQSEQQNSQPEKGKEEDGSVGASGVVQSNEGSGVEEQQLSEDAKQSIKDWVGQIGRRNAAQQLKELNESGSLPDNYYKYALEVLKNAPEVAADDVVDDAVDEAEDDRRYRFNLSDTAFPGRLYNLYEGTSRGARVIGYTADAVVENMRSARSTRVEVASPSGLVGQVPLKSLQRQYADIKSALTAVALESSGFRSQMASRLASLASQMGVKFAVVGNSYRTEAEIAAMTAQERDAYLKSEAVAGTYSIPEDSIVIYADRHLNLESFNDTVLHEAIHAVVSRAIRMFYSNPALLDAKQRNAIRALEAISNEAQAAGVKWDGMEGSPEVRLDEFLTASLTESRVRVSMIAASEASRQKSLWKRFVEAISSVLRSIGIGTAVTPEESASLLQKIENEFETLANSYALTQEAWKSFKSIPKSAKTTNVTGERNRLIKGADGSSSMEVSNAESMTAARIGIAAHNDLQTSLEHSFRAAAKLSLPAKHGLDTAKLTSFIKGVMQVAVGKAVDPIEQVKQAVTTAAKDFGIEVDTNVEIGSLSATAEQLAKADSLSMHQAVAFNFQNAYKEANKKFIPEIEKVAEQNQQLNVLVSRYEDISLFERAIIRDAKKGLSKRADLTANSFAQQLGVSDKQAVKDAYEFMKNNSARFADYLQAMARLGVDYADIKSGKLSVVEASKLMVGAEGVLQEVAGNAAQRAVLLNFAKNHPLEMNLLTVRPEHSAAERKLIKALIDVTMSDKEDAQDIVKTKIIPQLPNLGKVAGRIAQNISDIKAERRKTLERAQQYAAIISVYENAIKPVFDAKIRSLKTFFGVESTSIGGDMWRPVNNAVFIAPENPDVTDREILEDTTKNRGHVRFNDEGNFAGVRDAIEKQRQWLANPKNKALGGQVYNDILRQMQQLELVNSQQMSWKQKAGPDGAVMSMLGSVNHLLEQIGGQYAQMLGKMITKFDALYRANLHGAHTAGAYKFDELKAAAIMETGVRDPVEFKKRFFNEPLAYRDRAKNIDAEIKPGTSQKDRNKISVAAMMAYLSDKEIHPENNSLFKENPAAYAAVRAMLEQHVENNANVAPLLNRMGLKVGDTDYSGLDFYRNLIGDSASTFSRTLNRKASSVVTVEMYDHWNRSGKHSEFIDAAGTPQRSLSAEVVAEMFLTKPDELRKILADRFTQRVWFDFVEPFAKDGSMAHFYSIPNNGVADLASKENIADAFNKADFNPIQFAINLYDFEGGDPANTQQLAEFVGQTIAKFQSKYNQLNGMVGPRFGKIMDDAAGVGRVFMDAREADDLPADFLDYREFGHWQMLAYVRILSEHAAFGVDHQSWKRVFKDLESDTGNKIEQLRGILKRADSAEALEAEFDYAGNKDQLVAAEKNMDLIRRIDVVFSDLIKTMEGQAVSERRFFRMISQMAGHIVQSAGAAFTDTLGLTVGPIRKMGANRVTAAVIGRNWKNFLSGNMGSLMQALGRQWYLNDTQRMQIALANRNGFADINNNASALTRFRARLANEMTFEAMYNRGIALGESKAASATKAAAKATYRNALAISDIVLSAGIGASKAEAAYPTIKPAIYSYNQQQINLANAVSWLDTVDDMISRAAMFYSSSKKKLPESYEVTAKDLGFSDGWIFGDATAFDYIKSQLNRAGVSLDLAAKRRLRNESPLSETEAAAVMMLSNQEMTLESGLATTPTKLAGRFKILSPLIRWQVANTADLVRSFRTSDGRADAKHFASSMAALLAATVPVSLLWAFLRDEYDEEIVGKKSNVAGFVSMDTKDGLATNALALLDRLGRVGTLGVAGDFVNSALNVDTTREFSVDSRVFYVSTINSVLRSLQAFLRQDFSTDYATVLRPLLSGLGGAGYLQTFDAISNMAGFDSMERRIANRINVSNLLRVAGRDLGMSTRVGRGVTAVPTPSRPWVGKMVMAAYINDAAGFKEAYVKALESAIKAGAEDPYAEVFRQYQGQNPLSVVFASKPTEKEFGALVVHLGDKGPDVAKAVANYMAYSGYVMRGVKKPANEIGFTRDRRSGSTGGGDYRAFTTSL